MPASLERLNHSRVLLQSLADSVNCDRHMMGFKSIQQSPDPDPRAILKIAFSDERSLTRPRRTIGLLCQSILRMVVSTLDVLLSAFFVVDDEGHSDLGVVRPLRVGRMSTIAVVL